MQITTPPMVPARPCHGRTASTLIARTRPCLAGSLRPKGPRHDNDFADIREVRIPPTEGEVLCEEPPYLPANRGVGVGVGVAAAGAV
mgnify:CR=1 FL=1